MASASLNAIRRKTLVFTLAHLSEFALFGSSGSAPTVASVVKSVTPQGQIRYGDLLTYTLVVSATPGTQVGLYDPLNSLVLARWVAQPAGVVFADGAITGTLNVTPTPYITVTFVAQTSVPGTAGFTVSVTNKACVYVLPGTLGMCQWSNEVANSVFRPYSVFLPLVMRP